MNEHDLQRLVAGWLPNQRWYAGKGRGGSVGVELLTRLSDAVELWIARVNYGADGIELYHLPLVAYAEPVDYLDHVLLGTVEDGGRTPGSTTPCTTRNSRRCGSSASGTSTTRTRCASGATATPTRSRSARSASSPTGEQSNTSLMYGDVAILKVFRRLQPGINPDIELGIGLAEHGSTHVPRLLGSVTVERDGEPYAIAMLQEFMTTATDGWELAKHSVRDLMAEADLHAEEAGGDFAGEAERLGAAVAEVHADLAAAFGVTPAGDLHARAAADARAARPGAARRPRTRRDAPTGCARPTTSSPRSAVPCRCSASTATCTWVRCCVRRHRWVLIDFEGEPMATLDERRRPDSPLRDIAGMLRSFEYAGHHQIIETGFQPQLAYRAADGRSATAPRSSPATPRRAAPTCASTQVPLRAFEADKAVYEAVYEARNRPAWLAIPLASLARLAKTEDALHDCQQHSAATELEQLVGGAHHDPHGVLGAHPTGDGRTVVRTLRPDARSVDVVIGKTRAPLGLVHDSGVWEAIVDGEVGDYRLEVAYDSGTFLVDDPYRWLPTLGEIDLHLIGEGRHENLWHVLGAHVRTYDTPGGPVTGTSFAVWAPNARGVRVTGDFDFWSGAALPMRSLGSSGVWELFVPGVEDGARYKFKILGADSQWRDKADPMAYATEVPPATASVVHTDRYSWTDDAWLAQRAAADPYTSPMSIYEVHLGSWRMGLSYRELAEHLVDYVKETGFTHVEFLPVAEHPFGGSWGYQVSSYYAPSSRFGNPDEFRYLVDTLHAAGIGVIVDWVPAHFPKDACALARFDGTALYEHADPRRGEQPDWGTYVFDFGRREVRNFLVANALYWLEEFHVDGLRVDAVASMLYLDYSRNEGEWVPNIHGGRENLEAVSFLQEMNATVYKRVPGVGDDRRGIHVLAGCHPGHAPGRAGLRLQVGHGLDARHARLHLARADPPAVPPQRPDVLDDVLLQRELRAADLARRGRARQGHAAQQDPRRPVAADGHPARDVRLHVGASRQAAAVHGPGVRAGRRMVRGPLAGLVAARRPRPPRHAPPGHRPQPPLHARRRRCGRRTSIPRASTGSTPTTRPATSTRSCASARTARRSRASRTSPPCRTTTTSSACRSPAAGTRSLNTDAEAYLGSGVGNYGGVEAVAEPWHGQPASTLLRVPPLGALWLRYSPAS